MLSTRKKRAAIVGLDVQTGSVAATEVVVNGSARAERTGIVPLPAGVTRDGEVIDPANLGIALKELFNERKLSRNVRVGVANQGVVVRVLRLPMIDSRNELDNAIRFQAQDQIPMSLEQAVIDWNVIARGIGQGGNQMDVAVVAARRDMVSAVLEALKIGGLRPVGIDMSAFGMIRALDSQTATATAAAGADADPESEAGPEQLDDPASTGDGPAPAPRLYCDLGDVLNLAVALDGNCLFCRTSSFGIEGIAQRLAERRELTVEHSRQWLTHVGLTDDEAEIEGDPEIVAAARDVLAVGASKLADELRLSLEFFSAQEGGVPIEGVVACGLGTTIDGLTERLEHELGYPFEVVRPSALSHLDEASAARLTLSYGLGLEE